MRKRRRFPRDGRCPTASGKSAVTRPDNGIIDVWRSGSTPTATLHPHHPSINDARFPDEQSFSKWSTLFPVTLQIKVMRLSNHICEHFRWFCLPLMLPRVSESVLPLRTPLSCCGGFVVGNVDVQLLWDGELFLRRRRGSRVIYWKTVYTHESSNARFQREFPVLIHIANRRLVNFPACTERVNNSEGAVSAEDGRHTCRLLRNAFGTGLNAPPRLRLGSGGVYVDTFRRKSCKTVLLHARSHRKKIKTGWVTWDTKEERRI